MKKTFLFGLATLAFLCFTLPVQSQRGWIKEKIKDKVEQDMREKHAEPQREKGKKAIEDITYENDTRYPVPENPVQATLLMEMKSFKKNGKLDDTNTTKLVFGKTGECVIMNEGTKNETRMLFDYKGAATYMVNTQEKMAMKMPMINFQKMAQKMSEAQADIDENEGQWQKTDERETINGFNSRKYVYTNPKEKVKMDVWVTEDVKIDLGENHLFGGNIKEFSNAQLAKTTRVDDNLPKGLMVRNVYYEKNRSTPSSQMDVLKFDTSSDPKYFDLNGYEINDILDKL